jgi:hypothetical protein
MWTISGKEREYNRSVTAGFDYISAPSARGFGISEAAYGFTLGVRT